MRLAYRRALDHFGMADHANSWAIRPRQSRESTAQPAEHSSAPAAISPMEVNHLLAAARQAADARLRAEGASPAKNPPRIGWFIPVECYCLQANEL